MSSCIFSTYKLGENRVTSTIMSVLRRLPLDHSERIIAALLYQDFQMVKFLNQPSKDHDGVPDAKISANFTLLIETKIKKNMVTDPDQIIRHLSGLNKDSANDFLLVLTPDTIQPKTIEDLIESSETIKKQLIWKPFKELDQAVSDLLTNENEVVSERDTFLLKQLQIMMQEESLLDSDKDVLVVAARQAWPEYKKFHAYVCQPYRAFQDVKYLAFYCDGEIKPIIPKIIDVAENIKIESNSERHQFKKVIDQLLAENLRQQGDLNKILILSSPGDKDTIELSNSIKNDLTSTSGRGIAFTQGQRYTSKKSLMNAKTTSDLAILNDSYKKD